MPMASAGIIGFSPDIKIGGMEMDPKALVIASAIFVIVIKVASMAAGY